MYMVLKMHRVDLIKVEHNFKQGQIPPQKEPQYLEDTLLYENNELVGFYLKEVPAKLKNIINIANIEFNSNRVPKSMLARASAITERFGNSEKGLAVEQYSCILGSIPPKAIARRMCPNRSSVHLKESAQTYIKAMIMAGKAAMNVVKEIAPSIYEQHTNRLKERVPNKWRFAEYFTSTICNFNIAAPIHRDNLNVKGCVNIIITKRLNAQGGNLYLPDYDLTFASANDSMIVYPAWKNYHGVTEIIPTESNGYRNSLIWYALDRFKDFE